MYNYEISLHTYFLVHSATDQTRRYVVCCQTKCYGHYCYTGQSGAVNIATGRVLTFDVFLVVQIVVFSFTVLLLKFMVME